VRDLVSTIAAAESIDVSCGQPTYGYFALPPLPIDVYRSAADVSRSVAPMTGAGRHRRTNPLDRDTVRSTVRLADCSQVKDALSTRERDVFRALGDYNHVRPHSSLAGMKPAAFAQNLQQNATF